MLKNPSHGNRTVVKPKKPHLGSPTSNSTIMPLKKYKTARSTVGFRRCQHPIWNMRSDWMLIPSNMPNEQDGYRVCCHRVRSYLHQHKMKTETKTSHLTLRLWLCQPDHPCSLLRSVATVKVDTGTRSSIYVRPNGQYSTSCQVHWRL